MAAFKETTSYIIANQKAIDRAEKRLKGITTHLDSLEDDDWIYEELSPEELKRMVKNRKVNKDDMLVFEQLTNVSQ